MKKVVKHVDCKSKKLMKKTLLEVKSLTKLSLLSLSTKSMMALRDFPEGEAVVPVAVEPVAS